MYYTVGSQCPKIPIPDRVPIAELFSSDFTQPQFIQLGPPFYVISILASVRSQIGF